MSKYLEALESIKDSLTQDGKILEYTKEYKKIHKYFEAIDKLEQEIGCPLKAVIEALKNGIYTNVYNGICYVGLYENYFQVSDDYVVYLKDYKKTWWLREDKSE